MCASDNLRKVIVSSFVLHVTGGSDAQNVDDLYSITLQRSSAMLPLMGAVQSFSQSKRMGLRLWGHYWSFLIMAHSDLQCYVAVSFF